MYQEELIFIKANLKAGVVLCLLLALVLFSFVPVWSNLGFCPNFFIIILYRLLIYRPDLIRLYGLAIAGLFQDALYGYPLGVSILEIMALYLFAQALKHFILEKSFGFIFAGYIAYLLIYSNMKWFILSCFKGEWLSYMPVVKFMVFSLLAYPLVCSLSLKIQRRLDVLFKDEA